MFAAKLPRTILNCRQSFVSAFARPSNQKQIQTQIQNQLKVQVQLIANRRYAAAAAREPAMDEATADHTDIVKDAVRDLLEQRSATKSNRTEHLQHSYQNFMVSVLKCTQFAVYMCSVHVLRSAGAMITCR